jgi:putative sigma-54 modulation protein
MEVSMERKIEVLGKNLEITPHISDYVNKRMEKVERLLNDIEVIHVVLSYSKSAREVEDRYIAEITIHGKGYILRTEEHAGDILVAIDNSMEKLARQIERFKGKRQKGRGTGVSVSEIDQILEEESKESSVIARRKTFILHPMDELEAIEQMKLIAHENFFVFYNVNSNSINVLYKRKDGTYGLIEPKLG